MEYYCIPAYSWRVPPFGRKIDILLFKEGGKIKILDEGFSNIINRLEINNYFFRLETEGGFYLIFFVQLDSQQLLEKLRHFFQEND
ncbi:MAG: hypothetical protein ABIG60_04045 [Patescibacteria group bacterium]